MTKGESRYVIEWDALAEAEVDELRTFDSRPIVLAVEQLRHQAETKTRNRKPLEEPIEEVPEASWEVRVGEHRVFYDVRAREGAAGGTSPKTVRVLRVILKGRQTTKKAVSGKS